jgi:tRNA threonylcarbamoyladenosine biosynthesis protein TsaB
VALVAIETATDACGVAVQLDGKLVATASLLRPRQHASELVPLIGSVLERCRLTPADVSVVAVSSGPGSYTGLRIGVSTAKGLAMATGAELVAVPTLEALALSAVVRLSEGDVIAASLDARRGDVYFAAFRHRDGGLEPIVPSQPVSLTEIPEILSDVGGRIGLVGDAAEAVGQELGRWEKPTVVWEDISSSAETVARIGHRMWLRGETSDAASLEPDYLREFVANMPARSAFAKLGF